MIFSLATQESHTRWFFSSAPTHSAPMHLTKYTNNCNSSPSSSCNLPVICLYNSFSAWTPKCSVEEMRVVNILTRLFHHFSHPVKTCKIVCAKTFLAHTDKKKLCAVRMIINRASPDPSGHCPSSAVERFLQVQFGGRGRQFMSVKELANNQGTECGVNPEPGPAS